jgi:hypothetical protein
MRGMDQMGAAISEHGISMAIFLSLGNATLPQKAMENF